jgi:hypothetical protein
VSRLRRRVLGVAYAWYCTSRAQCACVNCKPWNDQCVASSAAVVYSAIAACALGGSFATAASSLALAFFHSLNVSGGRWLHARNSWSWSTRHPTDERRLHGVDVVDRCQKRTRIESLTSMAPVTSQRKATMARPHRGRRGPPAPTNRNRPPPWQVALESGRGGDSQRAWVRVRLPPPQGPSGCP